MTKAQAARLKSLHGRMKAKGLEVGRLYDFGLFLWLSALATGERHHPAEVKLSGEEGEAA